VVFVADDLASWLVGLIADAGRKRLTTALFGTDQERALRSAATAAVQLTASDLRPDDDEQAEQAAASVPPGLPVSPVRLGPGNLTSEHRDLVTEQYDLRVLGCLLTAEQHQPAEDPDRDQVEQTESHKPRSWRRKTI
jgi:hypothetical protein